MSDNISPLIPPKYETEVRSFARNGNAETAFTLRGHSASEIVDQFNSIQLAECERGYDAYLPPEVYAMAEDESAGES